MPLQGDDRAQSIQVGAVLLFGALVVLLSTYQAFVVPAQNKKVEFNHNQAVKDQLQELRNAVVSMSGESAPRSVSVQLGTRYPGRIFAVNPGPPSGQLATVGTTNPAINVSIDNATASGEVGDIWNGTARNYTTGGLYYKPNYNVYQRPPTTVYENSVLYDRFGGANLTLSGQTFISGEQITLVALNGSYFEAGSGSTSVDVRPVSASSTTVAVTSEGTNSPIKLRFPTKLSESKWKDLLEDQRVANGGHVVDVVVEPLPDSPFDRLVVTLEAGVEYELQMAKAGVGSGVTDEPVAYLTDVSGDGTTVPEGGTQRLVVETRDAFNNPVSGVTVQAATNATGSVRVVDATSRANGEVVLEYTAPDDIDGPPQAEYVNVSFQTTALGSAFDPSTAENVTMQVSVLNTDGSGTTGGDDSAFDLSWKNPQTGNPNADLFCPSAGACTWDVGNSPDRTLSLTAQTTPVVDNVTIDFAHNDSAAGTISPSEAVTGSSGEASTTLTAENERTIKLYALGNGASDVINITVTNLTGRPKAEFTYSPSSPSTGEQVQFTDQSSDPDGSISSWAWDFDGDGNVDSTAQNPTYTYSSSGTYDVTLTVTDDSGNTDSVTKSVTVQASNTGPPTTQNGIRYDGGLTSTGSNSAIQFDISNVDSSFARIEAVSVETRNGVSGEIFNDGPNEIDITGGDSDGYKDVDGNPSARALAADGTPIDLDQNAVLSTSGSGTSATVFVGQFGTASGNSFNQYDFGTLSRVSSSDNWDVSITLQFQNRGDVTFYFDEN